MNLAEFVAGFEGFREQSYQDPVGIWTIGFGATRWLTGRPVGPGEVITRAEALQLLEANLQSASDAVTRLVKVPLTEGQRIALTSFVYNVGDGAFASSTLLRKLNLGQTQDAASEFLRWNQAGGAVLPGLTRRREAERRLFVEPLAGTSAPPQPSASALQSSDTPMLPFVAAAIPALLEAAPALVRLFGSGSEVSERNAKAAEAVAEVAKAVTSSPTIEGAVQAIQADPAKAAEFREAVHLNMAEWVGTLREAQAADDASSDKAADRALRLSAASGGRWLYLLGFVAIGVVAGSYAITWTVLFGASTFSDETKAMLLGQVVIAGLALVLQFLFGSSISGRIRDAKDEQKQ